jgi:integrase
MAISGTEITRRRVRDLDDDGTILWIEEGKTEKRNGSVEVPDELHPLLLERADGKQPDDYLFPAKAGGPHWRDWPSKNVKRICDLAGVPRVSGHSMRGLHASLAFERGATAHLVAEGLRHENESVTKRSYAKPEAVQKGQQQALLKLLRGGKR